MRVVNNAAGLIEFINKQNKHCNKMSLTNKKLRPTQRRTAQEQQHRYAAEGDAAPLPI